MKKNKIIYVFDAYCSWCYGMGPVIGKIAEEYKDALDIEVLSGGMIPEDTEVDVLARKFTSPREAFGRVTQMTGQPISDDFIQMMETPESFDYTFNSVYPARALATLKYFAPDREVQQAEAIQELIYTKLQDLTKTASYKSVAEDFGIDWQAFVHYFESDKSLEAAKYEFHLARQLEVTSYPAVLVQTGDQQFYLVARGFTPFKTLNQRIQNVMEENATKNGVAPPQNSPS